MSDDGVKSDTDHDMFDVGVSIYVLYVGKKNVGSRKSCQIRMCLYASETWIKPEATRCRALNIALLYVRGWFQIGY